MEPPALAAAGSASHSANSRLRSDDDFKYEEVEVLRSASMPLEAATTWRARGPKR